MNIIQRLLKLFPVFVASGIALSVLFLIFSGGQSDAQIYTGELDAKILVRKLGPSPNEFGEMAVQDVKGNTALLHNRDTAPAVAVRYIEVKADETVYGNVYHALSQVTLYVMSGRVELVLFDTQTSKQMIVAGEPGTRVLVPIGVAYGMKATRDGGVLELWTDAYDPRDVHKYEVRM